MHKHHKRHIDIFLILKTFFATACPDSLHSRLKRNCSTKWIKNYNVIFVFKEFYPAVAGLLINCQNQEMEKFLEGLCLIWKR